MKDECKKHELEVKHLEVREGVGHVIMACDKCGYFKEHKLALNAINLKKELNFSKQSVV